jgi:hypothetical protein
MIKRREQPREETAVVEGVTRGGAGGAERVGTGGNGRKETFLVDLVGGGCRSRCCCCCRLGIICLGGSVWYGTVE